ncbi:SpoIIE family protein phosphatase [Streptomyces montanisoli]|uniref:SpoIIE family protein phosphatase n=1 Tax=Streptomyces montanisoli TaxID=2798581 RepID=A0A940M802_9ACTN|nr:SpoIIE family protein phosphatase [Streptomyces montanisoli]MBP0457905.1 SpoIIE family protein phosphatase [Streptomyces montanisoli]
MPSPLFADHSAPPPGRDTVDALITQTRRLRGEVDAVRQDTAPDEDDALWRWQRALCDLAVHQLDDLGAHLDQLRAGRPGGGAGDGPAADAGATTSGALTGRVGSAEWDLTTDEVSWSDELFGILDRPRSSGPLSLDELPSLVFAEDRALLTAMVTGCLIDGSPIDGEFRVVHGDGQVRTVHMMGEPVLDGSGCTASMWAVVRDVSDLRRGERAVRATRDSVVRDRDSVTHDRGAPGPGDTHRSAVVERPALGTPARSLHRGYAAHAAHAALDVAAYCPQGGGGPLLGGDWHDVFALPDGDTLLAVGDLIGYGAAGASSLAMVRGALRGMAVAGVEPGALLGHLGHLGDARDQPTLGSVVCSRYHPPARTFTWAGTGGPVPLLVRDSTARALARPDGAAPGAGPGAPCGQSRSRLLPGDVLVLHTRALATDTPARLRALAARLTAASSARECAAVVAAAFDGTPRTDDACLLVARVA